MRVTVLTQSERRRARMPSGPKVIAAVLDLAALLLPLSFTCRPVRWRSARRTV